MVTTGTGLTQIFSILGARHSGAKAPFWLGLGGTLRLRSGQALEAVPSPRHLRDN